MIHLLLINQGVIVLTILFVYNVGLSKGGNGEIKHSYVQKDRYFVNVNCCYTDIQQ